MSAIKIDADTYVAIYMGFNATEWGVGRATSSDGKTWTKDTSTGKALSPSDFSGAAAGTVAGVPYIWYEGNTLYLCFEAYVSGDIFSIFLAHSSDDGESWTVDNSGDPILSPSATTWFADEHVANPSIYKIDTNEYLMCFNGAGNVGSYKSNYHLGFAKATSVTGPWTIFSGVALAPDGSTGNWAYRVESMRPVPSHLVKRRSDPIEFVYFGNDIDSGIQGTEIGHAEMDPNTVQWTLSATTASKSDNIGTNTLPMYIGRDYNDDDHSKWSFEDIRTSSVARSTDWIHTRAANLFGGSDFITVGTPVSIGSESGAITAGELVVAGNAPTANLDYNAAITAGELVVVGNNPIASLDYIGALTSGELVLTGYAPYTTVDIEGTITAGEMVLQGSSLVGLIDQIGTTTAGSLILQGNAPTGILSPAGAIIAGELVLAGSDLSATVDRIGAISYGGLVLEGNAPSGLLDYVGEISSGELVLSGSSPNGISGIQGTISAGELVLVGSSVTALRDLVGIISNGELILEGNNPDAVRTHTGTISSGELVLKGNAPLAGRTEVGTLSAGELVIVGNSPTGIVTFAGSVESGELALTGYTPSALRTIIATTSSGDLTLEGSLPTALLTSIGILTSGELILEGTDPAAPEATKIIGEYSVVSSTVLWSVLESTPLLTTLANT